MVAGLGRGGTCSRTANKDRKGYRLGGGGCAVLSLVRSLEKITREIVSGRGVGVSASGTTGFGDAPVVGEASPLSVDTSGLFTRKVRMCRISSTTTIEERKILIDQSRD